MQVGHDPPAFAAAPAESSSMIIGVLWLVDELQFKLFRSSKTRAHGPVSSLPNARRHIKTNFARLFNRDFSGYVEPPFQKFQRRLGARRLDHEMTLIDGRLREVSGHRARAMIIGPGHEFTESDFHNSEDPGRRRAEYSFCRRFTALDPGELFTGCNRSTWTARPRLSLALRPESLDRCAMCPR